MLELRKKRMNKISKLKKILMWLPFYVILRPLITHNYKLRMEGKLPDKWYWADKLVISCWYSVDNKPIFAKVMEKGTLCVRKINI